MDVVDITIVDCTPGSVGVDFFVSIETSKFNFILAPLICFLILDIMGPMVPNLQ